MANSGERQVPPDMRVKDVTDRTGMRVQDNSGENDTGIHIKNDNAAGDAGMCRVKNIINSGVGDASTKVSVQQRLIDEGKVYVIEELADAWQNFICSSVYGGFDENCQVRIIRYAIMVMKHLHSSKDIQGVIDEIIGDGFDAYLFFEACENIVLYFSERGVELMKHICPSYEQIRHIAAELREVEERNNQFPSLSKERQLG